jgi:hypothetical protein
MLVLVRVQLAQGLVLPVQVLPRGLLVPMLLRGHCFQALPLLLRNLCHLRLLCISLPFLYSSRTRCQFYSGFWISDFRLRPLKPQDL